MVLSHIRTEFSLRPFGDFGVDIFFVISGFIIYHVTRQDSGHFFARRLIRIVPLYWMGTLVLAAVAFVAPSMLHAVQFDLTRVIASLFFIPYWSEVHAYHPILLLGWTLNYEMLFYLLFYLAMQVSHRHRFLICSGFLACLSLSHMFAEPESMYFFWSRPYIIEFVFGMLIAAMAGRSGFFAFARLPVLIAGISIACYCYLLYPTTGFIAPELPRFLTIGTLSAALVMLLLGAESSIRKLPAPVTRSVSVLADLSFATYIFHVYVMGALKRLIGSDVNVYLYSAAVFICTAAVAFVIFHLVERPARNHLTHLLIPKTRPEPVTYSTRNLT